MKRRITLLFVFLLMVNMVLIAQTPEWQWATKAGGTSSDKGRAIIMDDAGNSYVTGIFGGSATFGSFSVTSSGSFDIFVAKMDEEGNWLWATQAGGTSWDEGTGITIDDVGNIYVTGYFRDTATFGSYSIYSSGEEDIFVAKMDVGGDWLWASKAGGTYIDYGCEIMIDVAENIYVTGFFDISANFGSNSINSNGWKDVFVAMIDAAGDWFWVTHAGGSNNDFSSGIALDEAGNSYVTGEFYDNATFGYHPITGVGVWDIFVAKLDTGGNPLTADFSADITFGVAPLTVNFSDQSTGEPTNWEWDFDNDGIIDSAEQNPEWTYPQEGSYSVSLTISDQLNNYDTEIKEDYILVQTFTSIYDIQYTPYQGSDGTYPSLLEGETVFTTGIVNAVGYSGYNNNFFITSDSGGLWEDIYVYNGNSEPNLGDSVIVAGEVQEYFGVTEIYNPDVIILSSGNQIPESIVVDTGDLIQPINAEAYEGCLVKVENVTVTQEPDELNQWYISDGTGDCQVDDQIYTYTPYLGDEFSFIIGVVDYNWDEYGIQPRFENDLLPLGEIFADFSAIPLSGSAPLDVQFTDLSFGNISSWEWDFDNNGSIDSFEQNPTYTYTEGGLYTVSLTIGDGNETSTMIKEDYIDISMTNAEYEIIPLKTELLGNYPNPFNPSGAGRSPETTIEFSLKYPGYICLEIYNIRGQKINTLVDEFKDAGYHHIIWNGKDDSGNSVSSGLYFYQFNVNGKTEAVKKCLLLK